MLEILLVHLSGILQKQEEAGLTGMGRIVAEFILREQMLVLHVKHSREALKV